MENCIWKVEPEDRRCEFCSYVRCEPRRKKARIHDYVGFMSALIGMDVYERCRKSPLVWARYFISYQLYSEGMTQGKIAPIIGVSRTDVVHGVKMARMAFEQPSFYANELEIWNKFQEFISLRKNDDHEEVLG